ncbi:MAG: hypothetical protein DRJ52_09670 [Thermoprotei archaeon]|nr:MAG: hypothetical protein DRJ52_09670 [Thermoprotei archaeon]RLF00060.1 MAG: hypothetical protein DRJ63_03460 [Thermoprotei archaeon]
MESEKREFESRVYAFLAWIMSVLGAVLAILIKKEDGFVKFHAVQSVVFFLLSVTVFAMFEVLSEIPYIGLLFELCESLWGLLTILVMIIAGLKAYQGEKIRVPVVYGIAVSLGLL